MKVEIAGPDYKVLIADRFERADAYPEAIQFYEQALDHARRDGVSEEIKWLERHIRALKIE